jgi:predicted DNA-binding transcriptional regulator AlpA
MPRGEKSTPAQAAHARRLRKVDQLDRKPAIAAEFHQQHQHQSGLAPESSQGDHDRVLVHGPRGPPRYLNKHQTLERIGGWTYPTLWSWMRAGKFPRAFMIGGRLFWLESEINDWMNAQSRAALKGDAAREHA